MEIPNVFKHLNEAMRTNKNWELDLYKDQAEELKQKNKILEADNKRLRNELKEKSAELIEFNSEFEICPDCGGQGDVKDYAYPKTIDQPYIKCPECLGDGKVQK